MRDHSLTRVVVLGLLLGLTWSRPALADDSGAGLTLRQLSEQGNHYYRRKLLVPAMKDLERARAMPGGDRDYRTLSILARVYFDQLLLEKAIPTAREALAVADADNVEEAREFLGGLEERFGGVTFRKAPEQVGDFTKGIIHLEDRGGLIDPQKKRVFDNIAERFRKTEVELPITLYLPFGSYAANRAPFEAQKGTVAEVELILYRPGGDKVSPWWYVAGGLVAAGATATVLVLLLADDPPADQQVLQLGDVRLRGATDAR